MSKKIYSFLLLLLIIIPGLVSAQAVVPDCGSAASTGIPVPSAFCNPGLVPTNCSSFWARLLTAGIFCGPAAQSTAIGGTTATIVIIGVINILLAVVGMLAVLFIIIGGFRYVTAAGNEEQAEAAKKTLLHAILGLVIVILSFVMVRIISEALITGRA